MDGCNELTSCNVSKQNNEDERVFYYFSDISPLPTAKLTHRKRKAKQAIHISAFWFKTFIIVSRTALKKLKTSSNE